MSTTTSDHLLTDVLDELIDVRPFPATASSVMAACDKPDVTAGDLSDIIAQDPALSMKLLQIANSPMYGFGGQIQSVQHAAVLIGLRALKNLAVSMAMGEVFGSGGPLTANARDQLWEHALACGSIARTIAAKTGLGVPDEAFLGGIVHDVGKLIFVDHRPEEFMSLQGADCSRKKLEAETEAFGITHTAVGRECGENWGLPDELSDIITFHHNPEDSDFGSELIDIVFAANKLTRLWCTDDPPESCGTTCDVLTAANIDLSPEEVEDLKHQATTDLAAMQEAHSS